MSGHRSELAPDLVSMEDDNCRPCEDTEKTGNELIEAYEGALQRPSMALGISTGGRGTHPPPNPSELMEIEGQSDINHFVSTEQHFDSSQVMPRGSASLRCLNALVQKWTGSQAETNSSVVELSQSQSKKRLGNGAPANPPKTVKFLPLPSPTVDSRDLISLNDDQSLVLIGERATDLAPIALAQTDSNPSDSTPLPSRKKKKIEQEVPAKPAEDKTNLSIDEELLLVDMMKRLTDSVGELRAISLNALKVEFAEMRYRDFLSNQIFPKDLDFKVKFGNPYPKIVESFHQTEKLRAQESMILEEAKSKILLLRLQTFEHVRQSIHDELKDFTGMEEKLIKKVVNEMKGHTALPSKVEQTFTNHSLPILQSSFDMARKELNERRERFLTQKSKKKNKKKKTPSTSTPTPNTSANTMEIDEEEKQQKRKPKVVNHAENDDAISSKVKKLVQTELKGVHQEMQEIKKLLKNFSAPMPSGRSHPVQKNSNEGNTNVPSDRRPPHQMKPSYKQALTNQAPMYYPPPPPPPPFYGYPLYPPMPHQPMQQGRSWGQRDQGEWTEVKPRGKRRSPPKIQQSKPIKANKATQQQANPASNANANGARR